MGEEGASYRLPYRDGPGGGPLSPHWPGASVPDRKGFNGAIISSQPSNAGIFLVFNSLVGL